VGGAVVFYLEFTSTRLLGQGSGVWGLLLSMALFVGVSLGTKEPTERATLFLNTVKGKLKQHQAV
jgi:SSS family solute:Na+ symporter